METVYEMIKQSIRLYSIQEINVMLDNGEISPEFKEYLEFAPEPVKTWIETHQTIKVDDEKTSLKNDTIAKRSLLYELENDVVQENNKEAVSVEISYVDDNTTDDPKSLEDKKKASSQDSAKNPKQSEVSAVNYDVVSDTHKALVPLDENPELSGKINKDNLNNNPYAKLKFNKRIYVGRLVLHELVNTSCEKHMLSFIDIQVFVQLRKGKYSVITKCCPMCKKLYMDNERFRNMNSLFKRKQMDYEWIPSGEE